ncbi:uncharacterized protein BP01DRAFT_356626 [Aspergillus saccharolyticus JOP 1030-1]|uniref:DUF7702 domain-containing protein n=1 Tax=Aspergillus saccharolyticus JOP 1030-1 TaxID=1450539 RepID=A0A319AFL4_9EURO|nr:hypothetical protein BP01DRAFT_356626 [Aspergillus saccharolyticus JOP 1030-1]PYH45572.1 hypothetical protein BP01DRAFT_356626 [Aspergillus saccharolyticus JOP 1030-1]
MVGSIILLDTGVFPLIAATLGLIRIILTNEKEVTPRIHRCLLFSRMLFFVGLGLQIAGGCLEGSDRVRDVATGVKLVKAGHSMVMVSERCLLLVQGWFWMHLAELSQMSKTVRPHSPAQILMYRRVLVHCMVRSTDRSNSQLLQAMALPLPFLIVRG